MLCKETNHLWLGRFSVRLMQLRRDISWPRAVARGVLAHAYLSDLSPEKAALLDQQGRDSARPGRGSVGGDHWR